MFTVSFEKAVRMSRSIMQLSRGYTPEIQQQGKVERKAAREGKAFLLVIYESSPRGTRVRMLLGFRSCQSPVVESQRRNSQAPQKCSSLLSEHQALQKRMKRTKEAPGALEIPTAAPRPPHALIYCFAISRWKKSSLRDAAVTMYSNYM